jgi:hypothetical protein
VVLYLFPWPLRSHLALPDGYACRTQHEGKDVFITCRSADGSRLFSYDADPIPWLVEKKAQYVSKLVVSRGPGEGVPHTNAYFGDESPWVGGVVEPMRYSRLEVAFEVEDLHELDSPSAFEELKAWVTGAIQNFVDLYRMASQEDDVTRPSAHDLAYIVSFVAEDYDLGPDGYEAAFHLHKPVMAWRPLHVSGHDKPPLRPDHFEFFRDMVRRGYTPSLFQNLLLDAKEQAHVRQQYNLSVVLVSTAFEAFLRERLAQVCRVMNVSTLPSPASPNSRGEQLPFLDAIDRGHVKADLLSYVEALSGRNVRRSQEHDKWDRHGFKVRNEISHGVERQLTDAESRSAWEATIAYMALLDATLMPWIVESGLYTPVISV